MHKLTSSSFFFFFFKLFGLPTFLQKTIIPTFFALKCQIHIWFEEKPGWGASYSFWGLGRPQLISWLKVSYCGVCPSCICPSCINFYFKQHLLNHWSKYHINDLYDALFENCINGSAPPKRRAARAPGKKSFKRHLTHWTKFKIISQNYFS